MVEKRKLSGLIGILALFCWVGAAYAQEDYTTWTQHMPIPLNTTSSGAGTPNAISTVTKFPVLVRLDKSNFNGFNQLNYSGTRPIDIRFSKGSDITKHLPYQVDYLSPTHDLLTVWVLADTVWGNDAAHSITMHFGNNSAVDSSNGAKVFDTLNGFQGVWHLGDTLDATANLYNGSANNGEHDTIGLIGHARGFYGAQFYTFGAGTTASKISSSTIKYGGPWTLSAWVYFKTGTTGEMDFVGTGDHAYQIQSTGSNWEMDDFDAEFERFDGPATTTGSWHHMYAVRASVGTATHARPGDSFYVDGATAVTADNIYSNGNTRDNGHAFTIGEKGEGGSGYMTGYIDEVEMATIARPHSWAYLSYQNQKASQTLLAYAVPSTPSLSLPSNNITVSLPLSLNWNGSTSTNGAVTYEVQVATLSTFASTIVDQSGITGLSYVPAGLTSGTTYYWRVNASNYVGTQTWSSIWSFNTLVIVPWGGLPTLMVPAAAAVNQATSLNLGWAQMDQAQSYNVKVSTDAAFGSTITSQTGITGVTLPVSGLANNTTYYWEVQAFNVNGIDTTGWATSSFSTIIGAPVLSTPTTGSVNQPLSLSLNWGAVAGAATYAVQVSTSSGFGTLAFSQAGITALSQVAGVLARATTYYWQVMATGNGATTYSPIWSFATIPLLPGAPGLTTPLNGAKSIPLTSTLAWGTSAGGPVSSYELQLATISDFSTTVLDMSGITATSQVVGPLSFTTTYYWRVDASNIGGTGNWSTLKSFSTVENYTAWSYHKQILLNTTASGGANVANNVTKFPVLLRLNPSNFADFSLLNYQAGKPGGAADIRFSRTANYANAFPYQIEYWSPTNDTAVIWVLVDTVFGNNAQQSLMMHYGNGSVTSSSNGNQVFDTANGYKGVWHLADSSDATVDAYNGTAGTSTDIMGIIGHARQFNGTSSYMTVGTTASKLAASVMPYGGPWTLSAWVWFNVGTTTQAAICGAGDAAYQIQRNNNTLWGSCDYSPGPGYSEVTSTTPPTGSWHHIVASRNNIGSAPYAESLFIDGVLASGSVGINSHTEARNSTAFCIGAIASSGGHYLPGYIDEVEAASVPRTSDWVALSYANQQASQTLVVIGGIPSPTLSSPSNGATGQAVTLSLSWSAAPGASTYELQVSTDVTFATTTVDQIGITGLSFAPAGLAPLATYFWRVTASNGSVTSLWSSVWNFSTINGHLVIQLAAGWNMKSLNLHPTDSTVGTIFNGRTGTITDPKGFLLVKDVYGAQYMPSFGINSIGNFVTGSGYQIYTDSADVISVYGTPVVLASTPISLPTANWDIIAFLPQANMETVAALAGIAAQVVLVKDNSGAVYMPGLFNSIDSMRVGEGYYVYTTTSTSLIYPGSPKQVAGGKQLLRLPNTRHYPMHRITGNNATLVAKNIEKGGKVVSDNSEVGAFDSKGNLVGSGTVLKGLTGITIWGNDPQTKAKDGCDVAEKVTFRLWDGNKEYPLDVAGGKDEAYDVNKILITSLVVPARALITSFALSHVYPNPFKGSVHIAFDVPSIGNASDQAVEISAYDIRGSLIQNIVKGKYAAGSYAVTWDGRLSNRTATGSSVLIIRMKASGFDKRMKLIELK